MKINFEKIQKIIPFKTLKQPGILSFDKTFINAINLGIALLINRNIKLNNVQTIIKNKIELFNNNLLKYQNLIPNQWLQKIYTKINVCYELLDNIPSTTKITLNDFLVFLNDNIQTLCALSSIWFLTYQSKKPCLCDSRKAFLYDMLINNHAQDIITDLKPPFTCQEFKSNNQTYYFLLPTNWDVCDYFIWINDTDYWTNYWSNLNLILKQINDIDFNQIILDGNGIINENQPISYMINSIDCYFAFNYATISRASKNYQDNFMFVNDLVNLKKLIIIDCINGCIVYNE